MRITQRCNPLSCMLPKAATQSLPRNVRIQVKFHLFMFCDIPLLQYFVQINIPTYSSLISQRVPLAPSCNTAVKLKLARTAGEQLKKTCRASELHLYLTDNLLAIFCDPFIIFTLVFNRCYELESCSSLRGRIQHVLLNS